jgi:hypothetical protein
MAFAELEVVPGSGELDRPRLEAALAALEGAFVDPWDPGCWFVCADREGAHRRLEQRRAEADRRPYGLLVLLEPDRLWVIGEFATAEELAALRPVLARLCADGSWKARDAAYAGPWAPVLSFFGPG